MGYKREFAAQAPQEISGLLSPPDSLLTGDGVSPENKAHTRDYSYLKARQYNFTKIWTKRVVLFF